MFCLFFIYFYNSKASTSIIFFFIVFPILLVNLFGAYSYSSTKVVSDLCLFITTCSNKSLFLLNTPISSLSYWSPVFFFLGLSLLNLEIFIPAYPKLIEFVDKFYYATSLSSDGITISVPIIFLLFLM